MASVNSLELDLFSWDLYHSRAHAQCGAPTSPLWQDKTGESTHPVWTNSGGIPSPSPLHIQVTLNEVTNKPKLNIVLLLPSLPVAGQDLHEPVQHHDATVQHRTHQWSTQHSYLDPDWIGKGDGNSWVPTVPLLSLPQWGVVPAGVL